MLTAKPIINPNFVSYQFGLFLALVHTPHSPIFSPLFAPPLLLPLALDAMLQEP